MKIPRLQAQCEFIMPVNAGIQVRFGSISRSAWIPAYAGLTDNRRADFQSTNSEPSFGAEGGSVSPGKELS